MDSQDESSVWKDIVLRLSQHNICNSPDFLRHQIPASIVIRTPNHPQLKEFRNWAHQQFPIAPRPEGSTIPLHDGFVFSIEHRDSPFLLDQTTPNTFLCMIRIKSDVASNPKPLFPSLGQCEPFSFDREE